MDGSNGSNQPIGTNMIQTGPFADSAAVAAASAAAAAAAQRTQPSSAPGGILPPPNTRNPTRSALPVPPSTPQSPPPILHSRGLSPDELLSATVGGGGDPNDSSSTLGTANPSLSAVQQPVLSLSGVTFGGGSHRVVQPRQLPLGPNGSPPGSSPESAGAGQGGGWRQMQRQQHDHQFGSRGTMNTNPSAPPSKRRRTMMEAFGDMSLSRRREMTGLDLATSTTDDMDGGIGSTSSRSGLGTGDGATMASIGSTRSLGDFATNATFNATSNRPSRPSPIAGLTGVGPMQHIGVSSVASHSSPGHGPMRRSVGTSSSSGNGATPSEETIEDDSDDPLDVSPYNNNSTIAAPMALPLKPDSNVIRITSLDMESASDTASEMDEGVLDGFPPLAVASSTTDRPRNPVDAKIEELIRRDRMRAMIQAKLEAEGKKAANGSSQERKTRDDFDYQGTFTTAGSTTWRKPDAVMGNMPTAAAATHVGADASMAPISIPAAIPPHHPASTAGTMLPSGAASAAAMAASAAMPPPAPVSTTNNSNPNEGNVKIAPGMMRGRSTERRTSRGSRSRSLPRQYMKMAPQPSKSRDVSMASATTSGGGDASDMDL